MMTASVSAVLHHGDCRAVMRTLEADSVDAVVTDPPYGLGFMGKEWDTIGDTGRGARVRTERATEVTPAGVGHSTSKGPYLAVGVDSLRSAGQPFQAWCESWAREALRVLKPGGHLVAFGGTRTFHRLTCAIEDAGFEVRDCLSWLYGQGFPKSLDVSKAIDKAARGVPQGGADPTSPGHGRYRTQATEGKRGAEDVGRGYGAGPGQFMLEATVSEPRELVADAQRWDGWGTALKPAWEPIILARKPLAERSVSANVLRHGTGAINVDACRIGYQDAADQASAIPQGRATSNAGAGSSRGEGTERRDFAAGNTKGRWAANVVLDEEAARMLDEQSGERGGSGKASGPTLTGTSTSASRGRFNGVPDTPFYGDTGGASRFFYTAKADTAERTEGMARRSTHPTVKPLALMVWLVKLVTPPGGVVLDPFLGSGTTAIACVGNGFSCIGIEREAEYVEEAQQRIGLGLRVLHAGQVAEGAT